MRASGLVREPAGSTRSAHGLNGAGLKTRKKNGSINELLKRCGLRIKRTNPWIATRIPGTTSKQEGREQNILEPDRE